MSKWIPVVGAFTVLPSCWLLFGFRTPVPTALGPALSQEDSAVKQVLEERLERDLPTPR